MAMFMDEWPECTRQNEGCDGEVNPRRWELGYRWCLRCSDPPKDFCSVPMHKSNLVLITDIRQLKEVGAQTPRNGLGG